MIYRESIQYLESVHAFGVKKGMSNMITLMNKLGNPQEQLPIIHIAGTNGKGSVCAMLSSILQEEGYRVGLFTSPHLQYYNERIQVNWKPISNEDFALLATQVRAKCEEMVEEGYNHPTVFEYLTAMGFYYFSQQKVDFLILEVGLGGRFDATNIITRPLVSVITSIGLDHTRILGNNLIDIAGEKGGIIKKNCPVVLSCNQKEVYNRIKEIADEQQATLYYSQIQNIFIHNATMEGTTFSIKTSYNEYEDLFLLLIGSYQIQNVATVLSTLFVLQKQKICISTRALRKGLSKVRWAGRMEVFSKDPLIVLDGAHNPKGIEAFLQSILGLIQGRKLYVLFGALQDKDYKQMLALLLPHIDGIVLTEPKNHRAVPIQDIRNLIVQETIPVYEEKDSYKAFQIAKNQLEEGDVLCCIGSLYLVGEIQSWKKEKDKVGGLKDD